MGFRLKPPVAGVAVRGMAEGDVRAVHAIEQAATTHPWQLEAFSQSLASGYPAWVLEWERRELLAFVVFALAVDECHLLNLAVSPPWQGRGLGRYLLGCLHEFLDSAGVERALLEVRASNLRAQALYRAMGYGCDGVRPRYYPAGSSGEIREDAILMSRPRSA